MLSTIIAAALAGYAFQYYMSCEDGMIFCAYGRFIGKMRKKGGFWKHLSKPLGICIVCNTTWIGMITALLFGYTWWHVIIIGMSASALAKILSKLDILINILTENLDN